MKENALTIAYAILFTGIGLLAFTFISAYIFLISNSPINGSSDLVDTFGDSLAPLIEASIRIMFLGVMGWISSIITMRGVQLLTQLKRIAKIEPHSMTPTARGPMKPLRAKETKKT